MHQRAKLNEIVLTVNHRAGTSLRPRTLTTVSSTSPANVDRADPNQLIPWLVLAPKYDIDFAAPKGANPPVDESSVQNFKDDVKFLEDATVKQKLANAKKLSEVKASDYDAIFYVGGHGPVIDLAVDPVNIQLASEVSV